MLMVRKIETGFWLCSNHFLKAAQQMAIKEDWEDIGNILINDKDSHHIHIRYRTSNVRNALTAKLAFLHSTLIAKPIRTSNPV